jgi:formylglycine-generating enzyme required for sulfatase activity
MKLVLIQPGTFHMGWPDADKMQKNDYEQFGGPRQEVTISRPYYLGTTEVTQEQYAKVMGSNPSKSQPGGEMEIEGADAAKLPVESVNWDEALEFCRKLSELPEEKAAGRVYTLPTDAQWEYACRAGTDTRFTTGDKLDPEFGNTAEGGPMHLNEVGSLKPNAWGLYDMHGNVWEWCADGRRRLTPQPVTDPTTPAQTISDERIVRGGSYRLGPLYARSDFRNYFPKDRKVFDYGFRVCIQR